MSSPVSQVGTSHDLASVLRERRDLGRKLLVAYLTGGMVPGWVEMAHALAAGGADAIEVGLPFSDPMIDGPVIQRASLLALGRGATPAGLLEEIAQARIEVPVAVMTYYNLVFRAGHERMAGAMAAAGVTGAIVPDLPLEESAPWRAAAAAAGVSAVLLVAPVTPEERAAEICRQSRGFVYAAGLMGVTGEREVLASSAQVVGSRLGRLTDLPVCVGIGVSTPEQARSVTSGADGVVVGSAFVRMIIDGATPEEIERVSADFRSAIDEADDGAGDQAGDGAGGQEIGEAGGAGSAPYGDG